MILKSFETIIDSKVICNDLGKVVSNDLKNKGGIAIMWGKYLWKLRLLLTIPYILYGVFVFSSDKDFFSNYYFWPFAVYVLFCTIILHKMEKKEKKEKK